MGKLNVSGFFYNLGKAFGPQVRNARWVWLSTTGTEAEAIKVEREVGQDLAREIRRQLRLSVAAGHAKYR